MAWEWPACSAIDGHDDRPWISLALCLPVPDKLLADDAKLGRPGIGAPCSRNLENTAFSRVQFRDGPKRYEVPLWWAAPALIPPTSRRNPSLP